MDSRQQREMAQAIAGAMQAIGRDIEKGEGNGPNISYREATWMEALAVLARHNFRFPKVQPVEARMLPFRRPDGSDAA